MTKKIQDPQEIFQEIIADYKGLFNDDLISIILYGSAAGKEYRPGKSDINLMIVLSDAGIGRIDQTFDTLKKWRKKNVATPLFLTKDYITSSLDVFPIEYLNFQQNYLLVFGKDILKDLVFNREFIRLQCERELKGKLLLIRETFLETGGEMKALITVITQSISAIIAIFEAFLYLKGIDLPREKREIIRATCEAFDRDGGLFNKLLDIKEGKIKPDKKEILGLFKDYLREVRELSKQADALGG
ncbi:MAG: hypothetical protein GY864_06505 [Desulfobacterales bacterium]|nr:hypothetical protein [Desulfobacterales bacterium]